MTSLENQKDEEKIQEKQFNAPKQLQIDEIKDFSFYNNQHQKQSNGQGLDYVKEKEVVELENKNNGENVIEEFLSISRNQFSYENNLMYQEPKLLEILKFVNNNN